MVTWLDGFESGDISDYGGDTGADFTVANNTVNYGTYSLEANVSQAYITDTSVTYSNGDTIAEDVYMPSGVDDVDILWFVQSEDGFDTVSCFYFSLHLDSSEFKFGKYESGSGSRLSTFSSSPVADEWMTVEISSDKNQFDNQYFIFTVYDSAGNVILDTGEEYDGTYTSGGKGFGSGATSSGTVYFDGNLVSAPSTPQNLTSTVSGDDITLNWDAVNWNGDQGHYNVYRKYDGSAYSDIADVPSGTTSYTDSALLDGEQYTYYVDAVNSAGSSGDSNTTSSTTALPAPSNLTLS